MPLHRCAFDPQGSYTHTEATSVMAAVSSWGLYGDFYWVECLELTEQLRVLLESCARKASHCNGGRRRSQPRSWEGGAHPFGTALGLPQQLWEPSLPQAVSVPASVWARRGWRSRLWAVFTHLPREKRLTSISWHGAEKPSEVPKTHVASFFWWGWSALAFMEELDSQVFCVLCICCQYISERSAESKTIIPFQG